MANWFRLILSVFALAGLLAAGTGGAFAEKARHHCCPGISSSMTMEDHKGGGAADDHGAMPECCVIGACAMAPAAAPGHAVLASPRAYAQAALFPRDDLGVASLPAAPDLRPPIA